MPWTLLLNKWLWVAMAISVLTLAVAYERHGKIAAQTALASEKANYAAFVDQVKQVGEKAQAAAAAKEKGYADQITVATSERDAALRKLRQSAGAGPRPGDLSRPPAAPAGDPQVCLDSTAYTAALAGYRERLATILGRIGEIAGSCDEAQIDAQALISSWPK